VQDPNFERAFSLTPASQIIQAAEKSQKHFVILSGAKNLSCFSLTEVQERFFAPLRMTK
jgi:hypothetical protein